jgi:hypothetical protein
MVMKFKVKAEDLNDALGSVSIVPPRPVTQSGQAGYLFVVRGETCSVYSRDAQHVARATFPVFDVEGEGPFIYPAAYVSAFQFVGEDISFEVSSEGDNHLIKYTTGSNANAERSSFDPALMTACDKDLEDAQDAREFPAPILRTALGFAKPFLAKDAARTDEHWKTLQVFDASKPEWEKGNGYLFASDGTQALFFQCQALIGKGIAVHGQHLGALGAFLGKAGGGMVTVRTGKNMIFMTDNKGRVLGWTHHSKTHTKFSYYSLKQDKIVLALPVDLILKALKYTRAELDAKKDRIRIVFDHTDSTVHFQVSDGSSKAASFRVPVRVSQNDVNEGFSYYVNINQFLDLFDGMQGKQVAFRVTILPAGPNRPKGGAAFRTIDEFWLDNDGRVVIGGGADQTEKPEGAHQCTVTRFMPSMT